MARKRPPASQGKTPERANPHFVDLVGLPRVIPGCFLAIDDAGWDLIARDLPVGADAGKVRGRLDYFASIFVPVLARPPVRATLADEGAARRAIAAAARNLLTALEAHDGAMDIVDRDRSHLDEDIDLLAKGKKLARRRHPFIGELKRVVDGAERWTRIIDEKCEDNRGRRQPNDLYRDLFIGRLLDCWTLAGGTLQTSTDAQGGKPGGPLLRFLRNASGPVFEAAGRPPLSAEALRSLVRRAASVRRHGQKDPLQKFF